MFRTWVAERVVAMQDHPHYFCPDGEERMKGVTIEDMDISEGFGKTHLILCFVAFGSFLVHHLSPDVPQRSDPPPGSTLLDMDLNDVHEKSLRVPMAMFEPACSLDRSFDANR